MSTGQAGALHNEVLSSYVARMRGIREIGGGTSVYERFPAWREDEPVKAVKQLYYI